MPRKLRLKSSPSHSTGRLLQGRAGVCEVILLFAFNCLLLTDGRGLHSQKFNMERGIGYVGDADHEESGSQAASTTPIKTGSIGGHYFHLLKKLHTRY